jgi:hypothetical protein
MARNCKAHRFANYRSLSRTTSEHDLRVGVEIGKYNANINDVNETIIVDVGIRVPSTATARWTEPVTVEED